MNENIFWLPNIILNGGRWTSLLCCSVPCSPQRGARGPQDLAEHVVCQKDTFQVSVASIDNDQSSTHRWTHNVLLLIMSTFSLTTPGNLPDIFSQFKKKNCFRLTSMFWNSLVKSFFRCRQKNPNL